MIGELSISPGSRLKKQNQYNEIFISIDCHYLCSVTLVSLFNFVREFFLCMEGLNVSDDGAIEDVSHRAHQSMEIKYHNEPGLDVERLQLIQW